MYRAIKSHPTRGRHLLQAADRGGRGQRRRTSRACRRASAPISTRSSPAADSYQPNKADWLDGRWSDIGFADDEARRGKTGVAIDTLKEVGRRITSIPQDFNAHKTIQRLLQRRREMVESGTGIDWSMAEHLAFGTLLNEGFPGAPVGPGQRARHLLAAPLGADRPGDASAAIRRSSTCRPTRAASRSSTRCCRRRRCWPSSTATRWPSPTRSTMWEAQFGDFANGAQVVFDQFISSGERKWLRMSGLVCLLPHGYEGQGPEHSSARLERFLQLCAEDNWQVANCTTPANYFHILRRQLHRKFRKPLVLMTPKSLLRHKRVISRPRRDGARHHASIACCGTMRSRAPGEKIKLGADDEIRRVVLCSGKVYYDLYEAREAAGIDDVYLMRVEQLYPFPARALITELSRFPQAEVVWAQEEPKNMGAWSFIEPNLEWVLQHIGADAASGRATSGGRRRPRRPRASPASTIRSRRRWSRRRSRRPERVASDGDRNQGAGARRIRDRGDGRPMVQEAGRCGRRRRAAGRARDRQGDGRGAGAGRRRAGRHQGAAGHHGCRRRACWASISEGAGRRARAAQRSARREAAPRRAKRRQPVGAAAKPAQRPRACRRAGRATTATCRRPPPRARCMEEKGIAAPTCTAPAGAARS